MRKRKKIDNQILVYLIIIVVIIGLVVYAARSVLFRPWTARTYIAAAGTENVVYTFGGLDRHKLIEQEVLRIDLAKETIKRVASLPTGRYGVAAAEYEGDIYLVGGCDNEVYYSDVFRFDTEKEEFIHIAQIPEPRAFGVLCAYQDKLYYLGGWNGKKVADAAVVIHLRDHTTNTVSGLIEPLQYQTGVQDGKYLFVYGGENNSLDYSDVLYTINLQTWEVVGQSMLPIPLVRSPAALLKDELYIAGGWSRGPSRQLYRVTVNARLPQCIHVGEIFFSCEDTALFAYDGFLYLLGGSEPRFKRQIRIVKIDPAAVEAESLLFKSYSWW